jgi:ubiquinone/menaquinone biosynthesis C-methylase UbiE
MREYTGFAEVYDEYMDNIPYDEWTEYLHSLMKKYEVPDGGTVAEIGCGTGSALSRIAKKGYQCTGLDLSSDMLTMAYQKQVEEGTDIMYTCQDMRDFELAEETDCIYSIADSINYITSTEDLTDVFTCVKRFLKETGVFIFDCKTEHLFRDLCADNTFAEIREDSAFIWDNYYDEETRDNEYDLAVFVKTKDGSFKRFEETHIQHAFTIDEVKAAADAAGLKTVAVYDAFTEEEPKEDSERIYFVMKG